MLSEKDVDEALREVRVALLEADVALPVARDFIAGCPDIVVVDARANVGINYVAVLFASDATFAQAWTHYHQIAMISGLRVLKREGDTCIEHSKRPKIASAAIQAP